METISNVVKDFAQTAQVNSATSEEGAASSEELSGQSQTLKELVNQFKVK